MEPSFINYADRTQVWSGLGTDISQCQTVSQALAVSGLDFEVRQTDILTSGLSPIPLEGYRANIKDDGTPLGIVSTRYKVVQNRDAFAFLDGLAAEGMQFERAGGLQNGRRVFILARMPEQYCFSGDEVSPYIVFLNTHDGSGSIKVLMTPVRMICLNMLNLALRQATRSWSTIHSGDITYKLEDARNTLLYASRYMNALGSTVELLENQPVADAEVVDMVETLIPISDDMTELQLRNVDRQRGDLLERYHHAPDLSGMGSNAYRFINAVSDHATHAEPLRRRETYHEALFSRSIEGNTLVDRAFRLVLPHS